MNRYEGRYLIHGFKCHKDWLAIVAMLPSKYSDWEDDYFEHEKATTLEIIDGKMVSYSYRSYFDGRADYVHVPRYHFKEVLGTNMHIKRSINLR